MAARRKLFLTHAGELAHRLVTAITRDAMAMEFVRGYAAKHERLKVVANAERLREMEATISREALLLIAAEVRRLLPRAFGESANSHSEDGAVSELFYNEFLEALGRAMGWPVAEDEPGGRDFQRDLEIYATWRERSPSSPSRAMAGGNTSPFPDRCAILLDSAMMEQARRAAVEFQGELLRLGARIFGQLGTPPPRRAARNTGSRVNKRQGRGRAAGNGTKEGRRARRPAKKRG